jgi:hypothetical protein
MIGDPGALMGRTVRYPEAAVAPVSATAAIGWRTALVMSVGAARSAPVNAEPAKPAS